MAFFAVALTLRYTRLSCMPFRATMAIDRCVQAHDSDDALRQACLCLDRDLEEILATVNTINVTEVHVDVRSLREVAAPTQGSLWNPEPFDPQLTVPPHILVRSGGGLEAGGAA